MTPQAPALLRAMSPDDWPAVAGILRAGIASGNATFEVEPPSWPQWDRDHRTDLRLVAVDEQGITGWAAASPMSPRHCYAGVVEDSVYVHPDHRGRGIGAMLLGGLIRVAGHAGVWTIQAGLFPENIASVRLHERCGFRVVGLRERLGEVDGQWRDVLLMERRLP